MHIEEEEVKKKEKKKLKMYDDLVASNHSTDQ